MEENWQHVKNKWIFNKAMYINYIYHFNSNIIK